jgi:hypothetical protein
MAPKLPSPLKKTLPALNKDLLKNTRTWVDQNRNATLRYVLIASVLGFSAILVPRIAAGNRTPQLIGLAILAVLGLIALMRWPIIGFIGVIVGSMFISFSGPGGFNISQIGLAAILVTWFADILIVQRKLPIVESRIVPPVIIFILISIVAFLFGQISWYPFAENAPILTQLGGLAIFALSAMALLAVPYLINTYQKLAVLTWVFLGAAGIYVVGRFLGLGLEDRFYQAGMTSGSMFWTWLVALAAGQVLANKSLKKWVRVLLIGLIFVTLYDGIIQSYDWKSGWMPPLFSVMVILGIQYWKKIRYFSFLAIIPLYYIISSSVGAEDYSWGTRTDAWIIVWNMAQVSPFLGMGFANYYWYSVLFPIRGWHVRFNSHSQYVDLFAQTGFAGLACYLWLFIELGILSLNLLRHVPEGFPKGYLYGALGGLAGTVVAGWLVDWVLPFAYNIGMSGFRASMLAWIFMGGILTIEHMVRSQDQSTNFEKVQLWKK